MSLEETFLNKLPTLDVIQNQKNEISGLWGCFAHFVAAKHSQKHQATLIIAANKKELYCLQHNISNFETLRYQTLPIIDFQSSLDSYKNRKSLNIISDIIKEAQKEGTTIICSIESLLQPSCNPTNELEPINFDINSDYEFDEIKKALLKRGFAQEEFVTMPGEFSMRGGIIDIFSHKYEYPIRLDFFGSTLEEIRKFDPETQKSNESLKKLSISDIHLEDPEKINLEYLYQELPENYHYLFLHDGDLTKQAAHYHETQEGDNILSYDELLTQLKNKTVIHGYSYFLEENTEVYLQSLPIPKKKGALGNFLQTYIDKGLHLLLSYSSPLEKELLQKELNKSSLKSSQYSIMKSSTTGSFYYPDQKIAFFSDQELFNKNTKFSPTKKVQQHRIEDYLEMNAGDYIVHSNHGIGICLGIQNLQILGRNEDFLALEFADKVKVYLPLMNVGLVQKYIGGTESKPALSKIGSKLWESKKKKARKEVEDIAHHLLMIQAKREKTLRQPYHIDLLDYQKFAEEFPYEETPDQNIAIKKILEDMQKERYMDRIVCGDVGFGKTEIAMRAAYIAASAGKQVAILAPTTILVEQHYENFSQRFKNFPFLIHKVNRFLKGKDVRKIQDQLKEGTIDIIIGTHKLLSKEFKFKELSLLVVDEEQRFGVKQKEKLKNIRADLDILTLTATPIPRTLNMSLIGIKDISILATPPSNRLPIESKIAKFDEAVIQKSLQRELLRKGQAFFVHNRIATLPKRMTEIKELIPTARIDICHGQMSEESIEKTMNKFVHGETDILLSTVIIESGLDIPNANTILIDYANMYGLAQLHQMRGRIGRSDKQGYAIFLVHTDKKATRKAEKRLQAIEEYSDLGAGFNLSMADMEIRGVGNLLGSEQHGSVASIGYDMYCRLLEECILEIKNESYEHLLEVDLKLNIPCYFPEDFIQDNSEKLKLYRRLHRCRNELETKEIYEELEDRFQVLPIEVENLIHLVNLKILCQKLKINGIEIIKGIVKFDLKNYSDLELAQILRALPGVQGLSSLKLLSVKLKCETISCSDIKTFLDLFESRKSSLEKATING